MKGSIFNKLQAVGKAFMLPIALLPVAGLFLGIGASFTNPTNILTYNLQGILGVVDTTTMVVTKPTILYQILNVMAKSGDIIFGNLPLLFAIGVALALANKEKAVAALAGAVFFLIMNQTINTLLGSAGKLAAPEDMTKLGQGMVLGIQTLQMGVFGGIVAGLITASLHNKYYKIELPASLAFFGGTKFVAIAAAGVALVTGIVLYFLWPIVQVGITHLGALVRGSGYAGTFIYGLIERSLIPFGLHHVFYLPFWQTGVGGEMVIAGKTVQGAQNIFFAQLADPTTKQFSIEYARFMAGKFPFMIFGLPAAALAMYHTAKPNKKTVAKSLLFAAAFTAALTGITEPIEFSFLFVAPFLYAIHAVLAGISFMMMHILNIPIGQTFSGGLIDFFLFGILQGQSKTNWLTMIPLGMVYSVVYYFLFRFLIIKMNLKTPGREDDDEEMKLYTKADYQAKNSENKNTASGSLKGSERANAIIAALGGADNLVRVDNCATRLRLEVKDSSVVDDAALKSTGALGVLKKGEGVQVIYGPSVSIVKTEMEEALGRD
ncbi:PTS glucose transporter subunit IIA [Leptotrichia sp. OH3620_COT-345]|uniref:PTS transporter subunit EIIC n=1 Tax=Leptotrichia sp. OH3620_COT-345 TaxID=2491048 RepID=UPI000F6494A7|nr:PTS transporter subunit EIIC [Leptotrichia sp. OH3620_COT-345]RRD40887.1 PTS glucose transporter subunit IIA [Leptotrichia sp. OH3620_COT-345]